MESKLRLTGVAAAALILTSCNSLPRCPTDKQWEKTPFTKNDQKSVDVQGDFSNSPQKFLESASEIKDNMSKEEVMALGFTTDSKNQHSCDVIGWIDASQMILGNSMITETDIGTAMKNKEKYSAIRCRAKDIRVRTDRQFAYINNFDTCSAGIDITITIFFKKSGGNNLEKVIGVDMNKRPVKSQDRQSSFLRILGNIINGPKINLDTSVKIP